MNASSSQDTALGPAERAPRRRTVAATLRWVARVTSLLVVGLFVLLFAGEALAEPAGLAALAHLSAREQFMLTFWSVCLAGLVLAWKWELAGGTTSAVGIGCFMGELAWFGGARAVSRMAPAALIVCVPILCYLMSAWLRLGIAGSRPPRNLGEG